MSPPVDSVSYYYTTVHRLIGIHVPKTDTHTRGRPRASNGCCWSQWFRSFRLSASFMPKEQNMTWLNHGQCLWCKEKTDHDDGRQQNGPCRLAAISLAYKLRKICPLAFSCTHAATGLPFNLIYTQRPLYQQRKRWMYVIENDTCNRNDPQTQLSLHSPFLNRAIFTSDKYVCHCV